MYSHKAVHAPCCFDLERSAPRWVTHFYIYCYRCKILLTAHLTASKKPPEKGVFEIKREPESTMVRRRQTDVLASERGNGHESARYQAGGTSWKLASILFHLVFIGM